jgi:sialate O-acetylesterase
MAHEVISANTIRFATALALLVLLGLTPIWANPSLPHLISDHAVFQQERKIHVWGTAEARERVVVSFAGRIVRTQTDSAGKWTVDLPAMHAGGPFTLKITGKTTILVKDVLIGEVWVASGQSNMAFGLAGSTGADVELPKADYPEIRLFTVPRRLGLSPTLDTLPASWSPCTPESAKEFSAVAYYFARKLHRELHVPIGIIESAWPGTHIEEWMSPSAGRSDPEVKLLLEKWDSSDGEGFKAGRQPFDLQFDDFQLLSPSATTSSNSPAPVLLSNFDDGTARNSFGGYWYYDEKAAPETVFDLASPGYLGNGFAAHVSGRIDASDDSRLWMRFHQDLTPADLSAYSGVRFLARGRGTFRFRSLQPTISDWDDYASEPLHASSDWSPITMLFHDIHQEGWGVTQEFTPQSLIGFSIECLPESGYPVRPSTGLFNRMIGPLLPYGFRGVIWYQGESNALEAREYGKLLPALILSWRAESRQPDMQFLIVQLPNHGAIPEQPTESAWAELREAQFLTARAVHDAGLAVTIDVGDPKDLHPHRKAEVGDRLALWALGTTYREPIVYSGPLYESMVVEKSAIRVRFAHVGSGLVAKGAGELGGFAIAGKDRKFHWAGATIDGDTVVVSSPEVSEPVAVRYAWADSPDCNLFNAEGLPASPFRTDAWPGTSGSK